MDRHSEHGRPSASTVVLETAGLSWASEAGVVERVLVSQTATVTYDPTVTSIDELREWVEACGLHCRGISVPDHVCDPTIDPGHDVASPHEAMGHAGHGAMSMQDMVRDMRNRFLVAAALAVPILAR
jgi:P-type Cu2+ transporter